VFSRSDFGAGVDGTDCESPGVDASEGAIPCGSLRCALDCHALLGAAFNQALSGACAIRSWLGLTAVSVKASALGLDCIELSELGLDCGFIELDCEPGELCEGVLSSCRGPCDPGGPTANALAENSAAMTANDRDILMRILLSWIRNGRSQRTTGLDHFHSQGPFHLPHKGYAGTKLACRSPATAGQVQPRRR
jgi:hypothetical protein